MRKQQQRGGANDDPHVAGFPVEEDDGERKDRDDKWQNRVNVGHRVT